MSGGRTMTGSEAVARLVLLVPLTVITTAMTMWLWNMVVPDVFAGPRVGMVDAFGVTLLVDFLTYRHDFDDHSLAEVLAASLSIKVTFGVMGVAYWWFR